LKKILSTRPISPVADTFKVKLESAGFEVISFPTSNILPVPFSIEETDLIKADTLLFTSSNGVYYFFEQVTYPINKTIICIGRNTKKFIEENYQCKVDFIYNSASQFVEKHIVLHENSVLLIQGKRADDYLLNYLDKTCSVQKVTVYQTEPIGEVPANVKMSIDNNKIDAIAFTSPSGFFNFTKHFSVRVLENMLVACIGSTTKQALESKGVDVGIVPDDPSKFADYIINYFEK